MTTTAPLPTHPVHCLSRGTDSNSLRAVTFLAPNLFPFYEFLTRYVGNQLGLRLRLDVGTSYDELDGGLDFAFVCGLAYVERARLGRAPVEPLAAPVLRG